ncbi:hypothetical protein DOTSEDRAFT_74606, partial [Dothistroma septosporum NZE10]
MECSGKCMVTLEVDCRHAWLVIVPEGIVAITHRMSRADCLTSNCPSFGPGFGRLDRDWRFESKKKCHERHRLPYMHKSSAASYPRRWRDDIMPILPEVRARGALLRYHSQRRRYVEPITTIDVDAVRQDLAGFLGPWLSKGATYIVNTI